MNLRFFTFLLPVFVFFSCENNQNSTAQLPNPVVLATPIEPQTSEISPKLDVHLPLDSVKKHIYFTVDDGPSAYSRQILEMAEVEQAPMTVFLVGSNCMTNERAAMVDAYHKCRLVEVGNHSFCHANNDYDNWYFSPNNVLADFQKNEKVAEFYWVKITFECLVGMSSGIFFVKLVCQKNRLKR
jgi:Polysaccharide deacetylase